MRRLLGAAVVALAATAVAHGHALYLLPAAGGTVEVVFSDELAPDSRVKEATWKKIEGLKLTARDAAGKETPVEWAKAEHKLTAKVPAGTASVCGAVDYGVFAKGQGKPMFLRYLPKVQLAAGASDTKAPLEVTAVRDGEKTRFRVSAAGKPAAGVELRVMLPEGDKEAEATTDEAGMTAGFAGRGRFGVTARTEAEKAGEVNGQKYEKEVTVATLVVDVK